MEFTVEEEKPESQVWPPPQNKIDSNAEGGPLTGEPVDVRGSKLNIRKCPACDAAHQNLVVNEYNKPQGVFTHWFHCPTIQDPVSVSLLMLRSGDAIELSGPVCQSLANAQVAGRYLAVVFYVDEEGKLHMERTTSNFPVADFYETKDRPGCIGMLRKSFEDEVGKQAPQTMSRARPKPLRTLVGDAVNAAEEEDRNGDEEDPEFVSGPG